MLNNLKVKAIWRKAGHGLCQHGAGLTEESPLHAHLRGWSSGQSYPQSLRYCVHVRPCTVLIDFSLQLNRLASVLFGPWDQGLCGKNAACSLLKALTVLVTVSTLKLVCSGLGTLDCKWECKNVSVNWKSATPLKELPLG